MPIKPPLKPHENGGESKVVKTPPRGPVKPSRDTETPPQAVPLSPAIPGTFREPMAGRITPPRAHGRLATVGGGGPRRLSPRIYSARCANEARSCRRRKL